MSQRPRSDEQLGLIAGAAAFSLWGLFPLFFHSLSPTPPLEVLGHRLVWSGVFLAIVLTATKRWGWIATLRADRSKLLRLWAAGILISINWVAYVWAVDIDRVVDASLGYFINPLFSVLLGVVLLGEPIRRAQVIALAFGAAAVVILSVGYGEFPAVGLILAGTFGLYGYLKKGVGLDGMSSLAAETSIVFPIAFVGLAVAIGQGSATFASGDPGLDLRLLLAGPVTAVPLAIFGFAAGRLPLVTIGLLQYITPVAQLIIGWWIFGEEMPPARLAGFALIWVALILLSVDAARQVRRPRGDAPDSNTVTNS